MEALRGYGSSDDDDDSSQTEVVKAASSDNSSNALKTFGLISDDNEKVLSEEVASGKTVAEKTSKRKLEVNNETIDVEIPDSSFWSDTGDLDLQSLQSNHHRNRLKQPKHLNSSRSRGVRKHNPSEKTLDNVGTKLNTDNASDSPTKRKIYFIHPKVAPHLQRSSVSCKLPTNKEWTNPAHAGATNRIKWNVPTYSHLLVSCSMDCTVKIWNVWSRLDPCVQVLKSHDKAVKDVDWSMDGKQVLSSSYDKTAAISDVETGRVLHRLRQPSYVLCGVYHPDNASLCVTGGNSQILLWDLRTPSKPKLTLEYKDKFGQVQDVEFSRDGSQLFSCSDLVSRDSADRNLMAWDVASGVVLSNQIYQERFTLTRLRLHPTDQQVLAQSQGNYIAIFSTNKPFTMNKHKRYEGHKVQGYSVGFDISPDGQTIYSASSDGKLYCYYGQTGRLHRAIQTGLDVILDVACHPLLQSTVAVGAWDGNIQVWR